MKFKSKIIFFIILALAVILPLLAQEKKGENVDIEFIFDQKIPMRDGVKLASYVWKPANLEKPLPAIFSFSPYTIETHYKEGPFMVQNGYIYLLVDVRGRGNSEGEFWPWENDGRDGYDIVEWIAKQPWCDGQVGMIGGSYRGTVQWLTLKNMPPSLKAIIPTASAYPGIDFPGMGNIPYSYLTQWLGFVSGNTHNMQYFADTQYWIDKFYKRYSEHIPFSKLAESVASNPRVFKRWISHPHFDEYWKSFTPTPEEFSQFNIPILSITGYFDGDQPGALQYYKEHMRYGNEEGKQKHYLVIGPWNHGGTRMNKEELGGIKFGPKAVVYPDMIQIYVQWFDWLFKGKEKPEFLKKRVAYYVMNRDKWKYTDDWEDVSDATETLYLSSRDGKANDVFHSGSFVKSPPNKQQKPDVFEYDPLKLVPKREASDLFASESFLDQKPAFEKNILIYHSAPLKKDLEIAGYVKLKAYIELNVPDTDFLVSLYEITEEGKSINLGSGVMRARYRNSLSKPELIKPGEINLYDIGLSLYFVRKLDKGSRLRLIVTCLNSPDFQKNYNSGGIVAEETDKDARKAVITLYHDKIYPSVLELPVSKISDSPKKRFKN
ncbi:MAG: CocE/NonD family hydrolase [Candidatus Aminicenantes bacterium]|nr:MAG: CocE/NonD family hydrolase [Candidatus Aminicenantes bacterium]